MKKVAASLKIELANFMEMKSFAQFGSDLDASTVSILKHGEALMAVLKQAQYSPYQLDKQVFDLFVAKNNFLDDIPTNKIRHVLDEGYKFVNNLNPEIFAVINKTKVLDDDTSNKLLAAVKDYFKSL